MDWLTTFHYQLTNRKGNSIFDILLFAAGILFLIERLKLHESQLWNVLVWTMVILSSVITILNYVQLLMETWSTIRNNIIIWLSCIICFGGFMSSLTLLYTIGQAIHVATTQFELYSTIMLFLAASARITHCYLGGKANLQPIMNLFNMHLSFLQSFFSLWLVQYQSNGYMLMPALHALTSVQ